VCRISDLFDAARAVVVCKAPEAKLCAATTGTPLTCHVVAAVILLNGVMAAGATLHVLTLEVLPKTHLLRLSRILFILLASAISVPDASMISAGPLIAVMALQPNA